MIVIFDRQHYGKPGRSDLGAAYDVDADGDIGWQEREANLTPMYYEPAIAMLQAAGAVVHVLDSGWYHERHAEACRISRANPVEPVAYIACHVNAGGGDYAAVIHDARSRRGEDLAESLALALGESRLPVARSIVRPAKASGSWRRAFTTIKGVYAGTPESPSTPWLCGVCFEPYFLDQPDHASLATREGGRRIAQALATGLLRWGQP